MKKLLTIFALLFTIGAKAQLDSLSWSINGNGVDTLFYRLIPHNSYSYRIVPTNYQNLGLRQTQHHRDISDPTFKGWEYLPIQMLSLLKPLIIHS